MATQGDDTPEQAARRQIDVMLENAGWVVQDKTSVNLGASRGVAIREFQMAPGHGFADYLLFVDRHAVGVVEAKRAGTPLVEVEFQSAKYAEGVPDKLPAPIDPLPFCYESTGEPETRFTNRCDPEPSSRRVFSFHRPETLADIVDAYQADSTRATLNQRLTQLEPLLPNPDWLWPASQRAIRQVETSLQQFKPRALIQMATGSGKTFLAVNIAYRLIKQAGAKRILFLVDRSNLGRQALKEFQQFSTPDDGRKFTELYNVQHLASNTIDDVSKVTITTIQRLYSILRGDKDFDPALEEESGFDPHPERSIDVAYNPKVPIEHFDLIFIDECHRSIYGVWRQVLEYFDASLIGLTATPGKQAFGFFNQNLVMEYPREQAIADGVNVDFDVYRIKTEITEHGSTVEADFAVKFRDRETRTERMEKLDEDFDYEANKVGTDVIAVDQIRTIVNRFKSDLPTLFPNRETDPETGELINVPKTLVFARTDSHADDIVQIIRQQFGKGNDFCTKITSKSGGAGQKAEERLASFRNSFNPRIAVTVDMIATGTDVKPIECLLFMRLVKSRNYFEQMKGRGTRVIDSNDLRAVTPDAPFKDRFVIVDAVGATETELNETVPLERKRTIPLKTLLNYIATGMYDIDDVSTVAARLARLNTQLDDQERSQVAQTAGKDLTLIINDLIGAIDPDRHYQDAQTATGETEPTPEAIQQAAQTALATAVQPIADNPQLRDNLIAIRAKKDQFIDEISIDKVISIEFTSTQAEDTVESWQQFIADNRSEITALQVLYNQPHSAKDLTFQQLKELANTIEAPPHNWTPERLWTAYQALDQTKVHGSGQRILTDLVSLVHQAIDPNQDLIPFTDTVNQRFQTWLNQQTQNGVTYSDNQLEWLERIKNHIAASLQISPDDLQAPGFSEHGGLGAAHQTFGDNLNHILNDLTEALVS